MDADIHSGHVAAAPPGAGAAGGADSRKWFVAIVNNNTEKAVQERLERLCYETYVAKQTVVRVWKNGRKAKIDKVVIPSMVFIRCTEKERREIVTLPFVNRFLTDKAAETAKGVSKPLAVIPQEQIDLLRFMLGQSNIPVTLVDTPLKIEDKVVIVRGDLKGIEGEVIQVKEDKSEVVVRLDLLCSAKIAIDSADLERIK